MVQTTTLAQERKKMTERLIAYAFIGGSSAGDVITRLASELPVRDLAHVVHDLTGPTPSPLCDEEE